MDEFEGQRDILGVRGWNLQLFCVLGIYNIWVYENDGIFVYVLFVIFY